MPLTARILIVEDGTNAREALCELLRGEGYLVETARDGADATSRLAGFRPDLVLTDIEMPRLDGLALAALVRARPDGPAVVLMSSREPPASTTEPFVHKPIMLLELLAVLEAALKRRRRGRR